MDVDVRPVTDNAAVSRGASEEGRASSVPVPASDLAVGFVYAPEMLLHSFESSDPEADHPERPERIAKIHEILMENGCIVRMKKIPIRRVKREEVLLVHSELHWNSVLKLQSLTPQDIVNSEQYYNDLSLYVHVETPNSARLSCGGVIEAALAVARNELKKSFAIVRPPGHHAEPDKAMGFCFFNNVAVAAKVVQQMTPIKRILILDWDVHHGNGTQRAFNDDPSVLYISLHRYDGGQFYPCGSFGSLVSCGEGAGLGYSVNIPWPEKGMRDADYIHAFQKIVMPIALEFAPELVIISAGFDAADGDELGQCHVTPAGYAHMTHMLSGLAGGRLVVALEGGYNLESISASALAVGRTILGESPPEMPPLVASENATETVWQVAMEQSKYWKNIDPKACEPREDIEEITFSIPELLKAHRQEYMYRQFDMLEVPLMDDEHQERFSSQVMCSADLMDNDVLVIFAHEFGNLRVELANSATCDLRMEHGYLIDVSKQIVEWVRQEGYALLDVNLFPKPPLLRQHPYAPKSSEEYAREVMVYLWDNYVMLSNAKRIILLGHGPGVIAVSELLDHRTTAVQRYVQLVIQIVGYAKIPLIPRKDTEVTSWYGKHSLVIVPEDHQIFRASKKILQRHGKVVQIGK
ncbi:hypothetical protein HETIRDRAFT_324562 [Heterobasidion irregulare TC 32-1]|uniref:histone deacetylase n=1 Tax=Heterobasidion irregulare (strain TC 32-1) TaxID=747525 RepID=W4K0R7_HETIT|nr:uncharacterized protein HETIRDRAFT_324562 [Heterobasidion irregulare TC 32-1]ETW78721.1 hypothetical protein HETIRDRAFT_324562 [Heterobasidion irregulare TC 32-1]